MERGSRGRDKMSGAGAEDFWVIVSAQLYGMTIESILSETEWERIRKKGKNQVTGCHTEDYKQEK